MITNPIDIKTKIKMEITDKDGKTKTIEGIIDKKTPTNERGQFLLDFSEVE